MKNNFHEFRYVMHLDHYDEGVFFYREVLGLQPNYTWSIVPNNYGYRLYMGTGRIEMVQYPFEPKQGRSEFKAECRDLKLCLARMREEMPDITVLEETDGWVSVLDPNGNIAHLYQGKNDAASSGVVEKTNMFAGDFTAILYVDDLVEAKSFYADYIGLPLLSDGEGSCLFQAGDAMLEIRANRVDAPMGPSMIALEADSVNRIHDRLKDDERYREAFVLHDTDFDERRFFQILDPSGNVVEFYAYLRNVREEILLH